MKHILLYLIAFQTATSLLGQTSTFHKTYGGNQYDEGNFIAKTNDHGYIISGSSNSFNSNNWNDISLMKLDSSFNLEWIKSYGANYIDYGNCTKQTLDGGYIIAGSASDAATSTGESIALIKTDSNGNVQWAKNLAPSGSSKGHTIHQMPNGDYYLSGTTDYWPGTGNPGMYLAKINSSGNLIWAKAYRQMTYTYGNSGQPTIDGGYIIAGSSGLGSKDVALLKTDSSGNVMWSKTYGGINDEYGMAIHQNSDSGFIIAGYGYGSSFGGYVIKTDAGGNLIWSKNYQDSISTINFHSLTPTLDGGYIIGGDIDSLSSVNTNMMALKINASGNFVWAKTYGNLNPYYYTISSIQTINDGYVFLGANADVYLIKTDTDGNSWCNEKNLSITEHSPPTSVIITSVQVTSLPSIINYSFTINNGGLQNNLCYTNVNEIQAIPIKIKIYPNPLTDQTTLQTDKLLKKASLTVYNPFGQIVKQIENLSGQKIILQQDNLPSGLYYIHLTQDNKIIATEKLLIAD